MAEDEFLSIFDSDNSKSPRPYNDLESFLNDGRIMFRAIENGREIYYNPHDYYALKKIKLQDFYSPEELVDNSASWPECWDSLPFSSQPLFTLLGYNGEVDKKKGFLIGSSPSIRVESGTAGVVYVQYDPEADLIIINRKMPRLPAILHIQRQGILFDCNFGVKDHSFIVQLEHECREAFLHEQERIRLSCDPRYLSLLEHGNK
ncbi:hypothetical protein JW711_06655 [Candidatus Woesearchaeota archaeon]|nr:hypothetical protein [Candidatus Woesearchaeota archaeon]